jgi:hypothetical protein
MKLTKEKIPLVSCPSYVKDWISKWSGLQCQDTTLEQVGKMKPKTFVVDEDLIISNTEEVFQTMENNGIREMVIHALHIYKFNGTILQRLDELAAGKKVHFVSMSYKVRNFKNIIAHSHDLTEHGLSHDFNYILSEKLKSKRSPDLDFLFMINPKNIFRRKLSSALKESGILDGSIVREGGNLKYDELVEKHQQTIDSIESQLPNNLCLDALRNWPQLPDLSAYERIFCDVVIESANTQLDKISDGELSDLSEKTYKPILLGVPFVFLGSKSMFNKLLEDGYRLVDDGSFYNKWHSDLDFDASVAHLVDFLKQIKQDETLRKKLQMMAQHNYDHFWTVRKLYHRTQNLKICRECFGETVFDRIYDLLNI